MKPSKKPLAIILIGPQGSGKGTQASILAKRLNLFYWDMGSILREERNMKIRGEKTVGELIDKGILLTDDEIIRVFREKVASIPSDRGIIFDGIPRRIRQAKELVNYLKQRGMVEVITIFLDIPREETFKRLLLRQEVEKREDDTPEAIAFRLKQYEEVTLPILEYMRENTNFIKIDGRPSILEVTAQINRALGLGDTGE